MYNNYVKGAAKPASSNVSQKRDSTKPQKEIRKPVADNFVPKRFAISVDPPMLILQYLVPDTGKLYHHKMRLQSKMQETLDRAQLLKYIKNKHHLYFTNSNPKIKDAQIQKLLDKLLEHYELEESQNSEAYNPGKANQQSKEPKQLIKEKPSVVKGFDFLDYGKDDDDQEDYGQQQWDLDLDQNADIV